MNASNCNKDLIQTIVSCQKAVQKLKYSSSFLATCTEAIESTMREFFGSIVLNVHTLTQKDIGSFLSSVAISFQHIVEEKQNLLHTTEIIAGKLKEIMKLLSPNNDVLVGKHTFECVNNNDITASSDAIPWYVKQAEEACQLNLCGVQLTNCVQSNVTTRLQNKRTQENPTKEALFNPNKEKPSNSVIKKSNKGRKSSQVKKQSCSYKRSKQTHTYVKFASKMKNSIPVTLADNYENVDKDSSVEFTLTNHEATETSVNLDYVNIKDESVAAICTSDNVKEGQTNCHLTGFKNLKKESDKKLMNHSPMKEVVSMKLSTQGGDEVKKRFSCGRCGKSYSDQSNLGRHRRQNPKCKDLTKLSHMNRSGGGKHQFKKMFFNSGYCSQSLNKTSKHQRKSCKKLTIEASLKSQKEMAADHLVLCRKSVIQKHRSNINSDFSETDESKNLHDPSSTSENTVLIRNNNSNNAVYIESSKQDLSSVECTLSKQKVSNKRVDKATESLNNQQTNINFNQEDNVCKIIINDNSKNIQKSTSKADETTEVNVNSDSDNADHLPGESLETIEVLEHQQQNLDISNLSLDKPQIEAKTSSDHKVRKTFRCEGCGKNFNDRSNFNRHRKKSCKVLAGRLSMTGPVQSSVLLAEHSGLKTMLMCEACGNIFANKSNLNRHQKQKLQCKALITKTVETSISVTAAEFKENIGKRHFTCGRCGKNYSDRSNLGRHYRQKEECKKWIRESHNKKKVSTVSENNHDDNEVKFTCNDCGKGFALMTKFYSHRRSCQMKKIFKCAGCGKSYSDKSNFYRHRKFKLDCKKFGIQCRQGIYANGAAMNEFTCEFCGKSFARWDRLREHQVLMEHTRNSSGKPRMCEFCGMFFSNRIKFQRHKERHRTKSKRKRLTCDNV